jgi:hypothetical protein
VSAPGEYPDRWLFSDAELGARYDLTTLGRQTVLELRRARMLETLAGLVTGDVALEDAVRKYSDAGGGRRAWCCDVCLGVGFVGSPAAPVPCEPCAGIGIDLGKVTAAGLTRDHPTAPLRVRTAAEIAKRPDGEP